MFVLKKLDKKGFTLIEVLAVIVIISILGLVAIPSVINTINNSKSTTYDIMISNIKIAAAELYEEIDYLGNTLYDYNNNGKSSKLTISASSNSVSLRLQALVSNGFLSGSNNTDTTTNKNTKVLINPLDETDIGICKIKITKSTSNNKVIYTIEKVSTTDSKNASCPTTSDYSS